MKSLTAASFCGKPRTRARLRDNFGYELRVFFCFFFPSDDVNYLIITIGCLRWKMNCVSHRPNISPSSCSGLRASPCSHSTVQMSPVSWVPAAAGCCLHGSPKTEGKSAGAAGGQGGELGCSQASAAPCFTPDPESAIRPSVWWSHLMDFCQTCDVA